jgi:hypothetical protein
MNTIQQEMSLSERFEVAFNKVHEALRQLLKFRKIDL